MQGEDVNFRRGFSPQSCLPLLTRLLTLGESAGNAALLSMSWKRIAAPTVLGAVHAVTVAAASSWLPRDNRLLTGGSWSKRYCFALCCWSWAVSLAQQMLSIYILPLPRSGLVSPDPGQAAPGGLGQQKAAGGGGPTLPSLWKLLPPHSHSPHCPFAAWLAKPSQGLRSHWKPGFKRRSEGGMCWNQFFWSFAHFHSELQIRTGGGSGIIRWRGRKISSALCWWVPLCQVLI